MSFLGTIRVELTEFKDRAQGLTVQLKRGTEELAQAAGRPIIYLASSQLRKEPIALQIAARDGISEGLICVLTCVEPCHTFTVGPNRERRKLELRAGPGKCLRRSP